MEVDKNSLNKIIKFQKNKSKCPTCKKKSKELFVPFCSKKCSNLDLIKWLSNENNINSNL